MVRSKLFAFLFLIFSQQSFSQGIAGKDFWVTFLEPDLLCEPVFSIPPVILWSDDTLELYITSPYATKVTIEAKENVPIGSGITYNYSKTITLVPNKVTYVRLPPYLACHALYSDIVTKNGVHVFADSAIKVNAVTRHKLMKGATAVMPSESIPFSPEYFVTTNKSDENWSCYANIKHKDAKSPEFGIVGIADQSIIEIVPVGVSTTRNNEAKKPFVIILKKGETFGYMTNDSDLTGTIIRSRTATSKFAVFAGNRITRTFTPRANGSICKSNTDHTFEQMFPTVTWGSTYTALPFKYNDGYTLKIVAAENFTKVNINGNYYQTLQQGDYFTYSTRIDTSIAISADKPIAVTQYTKGAACNGHPAPKTTLGGVSQIQLIPDVQCSIEANVSNTMRDWKWTKVSENFLNVMVNLMDTAAFQINDKSLPANAWKTNANMNGKAYAQIAIDSINYNLKSNKGFIAYVYGYGPFEGHAYAASANFKPIQNNFYWNAQCKGELITFNAIALDSFTNFKWYFGDQTPVQNGKVVQKKFKDTGWVNITLYAQHQKTGAVDSVSKKIFIGSSGLGPVLIKDTAICGLVQFAVFAKGFDYENTYEWNDGHPNYYKGIKGAGQYWLKITERSGCVYVDTLNVVGYPLPFANYTVSDSILCFNQNKSIKFTNLATSIDSVVAHKWNFGDVKITDTSRIVPHLYSQTGTYTTHLTVRTYRGCEHDTTLRIRILKAPKADFTLSDTVACLNTNNFDLVNTSTTDTGKIISTKWLFSDKLSVLDKDSVSKKFATAGTQTLVLKVTNLLGCADSLIKKVEVKKTPLVDFTSSAFSNCFRSQNFEFKYLPNVNNDSIVKKTWYYGSDSAKQLNSLSGIQFPGIGAYPIQLKLESTAGCIAVLKKIVNVNPNPNALIIVDDSIQCQSTNVFNFSSNSTISAGKINLYDWNFGDASRTNLQQPFPKTYSTPQTYSVVLKIVSDSACSDSAQLNLQVLANPKLNTPIAKAACLNDSVIFSVSPAPGSGSIANYTWSFGDGNTGQNQNTKHLYTLAGSYKAKVLANNSLNCTDSAFVNFKIVENPKADYVFVHYKRDPSGIRFLFLDRSSKATNWQWQFGTTGSSILQDPDYYFTDTGTVKIKLIVSNQNICFDTIERLLPILEQIDFFFPNVFTPNNNGLNEGFGLSPTQYNLVKDYRLQVFNRWGEKLFESNDKTVEWLVADDKNILQGVYIYKAAIRDIYNVYHDVKGVVEVIR
jgi:gliding motility-associated-like protein